MKALGGIYIFLCVLVLIGFITVVDSFAPKSEADGVTDALMRYNDDGSYTRTGLYQIAASEHGVYRLNTETGAIMFYWQKTIGIFSDPYRVCGGPKITKGNDQILPKYFRDEDGTVKKLK